MDFADKFSMNTDRIRRVREYLEHPRIIDVQNHRSSLTDSTFPPCLLLLPVTSSFELRHICSIGYNSVFVATWNVGGKSPPSNMNLDDWLHASPAADIYVLGYALVSHYVALIFLI